MGGLSELLPRLLVHTAPQCPRCQSTARDPRVRRLGRHQCRATLLALLRSPGPPSAEARQALSQPRTQEELATRPAEAVVCTLSGRASRPQRRRLRGSRLERRTQELRGTDSLAPPASAGRSQFDGPRRRGTIALYGLPPGLPRVPRACRSQDARCLEQGAPPPEPARPHPGLGENPGGEDGLSNIPAYLVDGHPRQTPA